MQIYNCLQFFVSFVVPFHVYLWQNSLVASSLWEQIISINFLFSLSFFHLFVNFNGYPFDRCKRILLCDLIFNTFSRILKVQIFGSPTPLEARDRIIDILLSSKSNEELNTAMLKQLPYAMLDSAAGYRRPCTEYSRNFAMIVSTFIDLTYITAFQMFHVANSSKWVRAAV